jgi:geranylgeranyl transferase type-2 subunit alpha
LTETFDVSVQSEFDFTTLMIYKNFSNYSAWHRRSVLLPRLESVIGEAELLHSINADLKLIKSAYFTEPADQSCWFYLRWLVNFASERFGDRVERYTAELNNISELLSIEPEAPLVLSAWIHFAIEAGLPAKDIQEKRVILARVDPLRSGMHISCEGA